MVQIVTNRPNENLAFPRASFFHQVPEFKDCAIDIATEQYVRDRLANTAVYEQEISDILNRYGVIDTPARIRFGPELEFYNVAGLEGFKQRLSMLVDAINVESPEETFEEQLGHLDHFMPPLAQHENLANAFRTGLPHGRHVLVECEPGHRLGLAIEKGFSLDGHAQMLDFIAIFQHEIVSPPRSSKGLGLWLATIAQRVIDQAPEFGLKRSEIVTSLHDMASSSLHFHISLTGMREGEPVNPLQRDAFPHERGNRRRDPAAVSQLALHIAHAMNDFLKDFIYIFAPTADAYVRFSDQQYVGTSFIGFTPRRARFQMGSAMFRGEGRPTFRVEDGDGKPDTGPLRIELRAADVGCIGHPNKCVYTEQMAAPFDVVEALVYMVHRGVLRWAESREVERVGGRGTPPHTEDALYQQTFSLPRTWDDSSDLLLNAARERGGRFMTRKRAMMMINRSEVQDEINNLDRKPNLPRGQHENRKLFLRGS